MRVLFGAIIGERARPKNTRLTYLSATVGKLFYLVVVVVRGGDSGREKPRDERVWESASRLQREPSVVLVALHSMQMRSRLAPARRLSLSFSLVLLIWSAPIYRRI